MADRKISVVQAVILLMLAVGISNHVLIMPSILDAAGRDAWISGLAAVVPSLLWGIILYLLIRATGQQRLFDWLKARYPSYLVHALSIPMILYVLSTLYVAVRDTATWTRIAYLPSTPTAVVVAMLLLCGLLSAAAGIRALAITGGILLPVVILLGYFVMTVNFQYKDYSYLRPMMENGIQPVGKGMVYALGGLFEFILLLLFQQHVRGPVRLPAVLLAVVLLAGLIVGPTTGSIAIFGSAEAADLRFPAFEQWRMVRIGRFISHLDFFSIYQWISGSLMRIGLGLFILSDLLMLNRTNRELRWLLLICAALFAVIVYLPISDMQFTDFLHRWYYPGIAVLFAVYPLLLLFMAWMKRGGNRDEAVEPD